MRRLAVPSVFVLVTVAGCGSPGSMQPVDGSTQPSGDANVDPRTDGGGTPTDGGGTGTVGWRLLALPAGPNGEDHSSDRVTGVLCTSASACVVVTDDLGIDSPSGAVYAANDRAVTAVIASGTTMSATAMVSGQVGFLGLSRTRGGVVARANVAGLYLAATGDFTNPTSWTSAFTGATASGSLGLNAQFALQDGADGRWALITQQGSVYDAPSAPGPSTVWTPRWSPESTPSVPENFSDMLAADPTLCDSDVTTSVQPNLTQGVYISPDLALMLLPAGGINQNGSATPGVCYSTDGGHVFHHVALPGVGDELGPLAVTCVDNDHCFAYNGLNSDANSAYVYRTSNASAGAGMTWTRATLPAALTAGDGVDLRNLFFAPDGTHGWIAGANHNGPLLLRTTDGGQTWLDVTSGLAGMTTERLHSGFALDATHIWVGGENATLLSSDRGGQ